MQYEERGCAHLSSGSSHPRRHYVQASTLRVRHLHGRRRQTPWLSSQSRGNGACHGHLVAPTQSVSKAACGPPASVIAEEPNSRLLARRRCEVIPARRGQNKQGCGTQPLDWLDHAIAYPQAGLTRILRARLGLCDGRRGMLGQGLDPNE